MAFKYDGPGRRVEKKIYTYNSGSSYDLTETRHFVYDGWQMVGEIITPSAGSASTNIYVWGADQSLDSGLKWQNRCRFGPCFSEWLFFGPNRRFCAFQDKGPRENGVFALPENMRDNHY